MDYGIAALVVGLIGVAVAIGAAYVAHIDAGKIADRNDKQD